MKSNLLFILMFTIVGISARSQPTNKEGFIQAKHEETKKKYLTLVQDGEEKSINLKYRGEETAHFYIFDLEGTMVYQAQLKKWEVRIIKNLIKGVYTYSLFVNDEGREEGKLTVK